MADPRLPTAHAARRERVESRLAWLAFAVATAGAVALMLLPPA